MQSYFGRYFFWQIRTSGGPPVMNYRFLTTETNLKALYIFSCLFTTSSVKLFVVNVQIFVWKKEKQHS